jgi:hypothetical protein
MRFPRVLHSSANARFPQYYFLLTWTVGLPGSSHAETTFAGWGNVSVGLDFIIVQAGIKVRGGITAARNKDGGRCFHSGNLVRLSGTEKGGGHAQDQGKQDGKDWLLHGGGGTISCRSRRKK